MRRNNLLAVSRLLSVLLFVFAGSWQIRAQWETVAVIESQLFGSNGWTGSYNGSPYDCSELSIQKNPVVNDRVWVEYFLETGYKYRYTFYIKPRLPVVYCEMREGLDDGPGGNNLAYANAQEGSGNYTYTSGPFNALDALAMVCDSSFKYTSEPISGDGKTHFLKVVVTDVQGDGATKPIRAAHCIIEKAFDETYPYPLAPSMLTISHVKENIMKLEWEDNSNNELGFLVNRKTEAGSYDVYDSIDADTTWFYDTIQDPGMVWYRVCAFNENGISEYSNEDSIAIFVEPPEAPASFQATSVSSRRIDLDWTDSVVDESGYVVEYTSVGDWSAIAGSPFNTGVIHVPVFGLLAETTYSFRIYSFNNMGNSDTLETVAVTGSFSDDGIVFPDDAGVLNVRDFGAVGDGKTDDTESIQSAMAVSAGKFVYFPVGTYLVSDRIEWPPDGKNPPVTMIGQDREKSVIRLKDIAENYQTAGLSRAVIWTEEMGSADNFRNHIRNLTVHTGTGNPEAIGIQFMSNNMGAVTDVNIISGDGQGDIGLDLAYNNLNGPLLIKNVKISGFGVGIKTQGSVNSQTFENITLENQSEFGFVNNGQVVSIRKISSTGSVTPVYNAQSGGVITLIDGDFICDNPDKIAVANSGILFARNIHADGFQVAIFSTTGNKGQADGPYVDQYASHNIHTLNSWTKPVSLNLEIRNAPDLQWEGDFDQWANVQDYGAVAGDGNDDAQSIRDAIASGRTTVYFPKGTYNVSGTVEITGNVNRLIGLESNMAVGTQEQPVFKLVDSPSSPDTVEISHMSVTPTVTTTAVDNASSGRTLVVKHCKGFGGVHTGTGNVFYDDVGTGVQKPLHFVGGKGQHAWIRQLSNEPREGVTHLVNRGGKLWILGHKTEQPGTLIETSDSGYTEVCGGFVYSVGGDNTVYPMYINHNSYMSATMGGAHYSAGYSPYTTMVEETQGEETKNLLASAVPSRAGFRAMALYAGYPEGGMETVPDTPGGLSATTFSDTEISLSWLDNSLNEKGFILEFSTDGEFELLDSIGSDQTGYEVEGLLASTVYTFRILAWNDVGNSAWSNEASDTTDSDVGIGRDADRNSLELMRIWPNPASGALYVQFKDNGAEPVLLKLYNLTGHQVFQDRFEYGGSGVKLDLAGLQSGCYIMEIRSGDKMAREKVIIN